jgi:hypothetical protein
MALLPSSALAVQDYSLIMMWPLSVRPLEKAVGKKTLDMAEAVRRAVEADGRWKEIENKLQHMRPSATIGTEYTDLAKEEYAEFVYFYPFVQQFLFGDPKKGSAAPLLSIYRFKEIDEIEVELTINKKPSAAFLQVPRLNLYVFGTGDVFLVSEVMASGDVAWDGKIETPPCQRTLRPLWLSEVLQLNEQLRRAYAPYFDANTQPGYAIPHAVWRYKGQALPWATPEAGGDSWETLSAYLTHAEGPRNPLYLRWEALLPKFPDTVPYEWRQVQDDRMPAMASVVVGDPEAIEQGDWVRLANFDAPDSILYGKRFLHDFEDKNCYDRFWEPGQKYCTTRYVTTGFGFAQVLKKDGYFDQVGQTHFRSLYFQMALISHFHQAALQNLSDQMALAVQNANLEHPEKMSRRYKEDMERIMARMVQFTQSYWFTDVSNQIQARDLFAFIRQPLGVDALFAQVSAEARETNAFLNRLEDERTAKAAESFNRIAAVGAVLGVTVGAMGMNLLIPSQDYDWHNAYAWAHGGLVLALVMLLTFVGMFVMKKTTARGGFWKFIGLFACLLLLLGSVVGLASSEVPKAQSCQTCPELSSQDLDPNQR